MTSAFRSGHRLATLALIGLVVFGIIIRAVGLDRSLWLDEASVSNSVLEPTLRQMFFYEAWLQTAGPLFLVAVRFAVDLFGFANWSLRVVPFLSGAAACVLMAVLLGRIRSCPRPLPIIGMALFALSPSAIYYSYTTKQYSSELLAGTALLLVATRYVESQSRVRWLALAITVVTALTLAYGTVLLLPGVMIATCPWFIGWWKNGRFRPLHWSRTPEWLLLGAISAAVFGVEYLLFVVPNSPPELGQYWQSPYDSGLLGVIQVVFGFVYLAVHHLPAPSVVASPDGLRLFAGVFAFIGLVALRFAKGWFNNRRDSLDLAFLLSVTSVFVTLVLAFFDFYPMIYRTTLLLLPNMIVVVVWLLRLLHEGPLNQVPGRFRPVAWGLVLSITLLALLSGTHIRWEPKGDEDLEGAVTFLSQNVRAADGIYVHAAAVEGFKLYRRMLGWSETSPATLGKVGQPCCPRIAEPTDVPRAVLLRREVESCLVAAESRRIWVLSTARPSHWNQIGSNHNEAIRSILYESGCRAEPSVPFHNLSLVPYRCGPN